MGKKGVIIGIGVIGVIVSIIALANTYQRMRQDSKDLVSAQADVKQKCQDLKDALLAPDLPQSSYQNELPYYNNNCADLTGGLK